MHVALRVGSGGKAIVRVPDPTNTLVPLEKDKMMNNQVQNIMQKQFLPDYCGDIIKHICWYV